MLTRNMNIRGALLLTFCSLLLLVGETVEQNTNPSLRPPLGNSLVLKSRTQNGKEIYKCSTNEWVFEGATADLVMASNPSISVGSYSSQNFNRRGRPVATWMLENPAGDAAESGKTFSSVSGKELVSLASGGHISEALLQATSHEFDGSASLISYIQRLFPQGGAAPLQDICQLDATVVEIPFEVEFWFWQQDLWPPAVPASLSVSNENVIQGFFGEGVVVYRYGGKAWEQTQADARLFSVPGGSLQGKFFVQSSALHGRNTGGSFWWELNAPNGFQAVGKLQNAPVPVGRNCLPWSLVTISSFSNNNSAIWTYSHVQMVSTRGGLPPVHTLFKPIKGMIIRSPFTAIFWFYSK
ncbi:hypothetical protein O6H91_22G038900 [Diphasiastrum complanatum]|uniref:Uncharacterized protein n=1 Tax=Diphasiastrum complanatum TaxID=34168 RepID=A0ACC2AFZ0_DIPCM|nr:hypothetical protein O6H91_22G038900 [Diphasiastrum complanatum]